ncbi:MAG TPA: flagellar biosynthesis protein FlhF [Ignavibacteria bacterium]
MKIKKFTGISLKEATELMKTELGESAIILNTKNIVEDETGNTLYEITAAIDEEPIITNNNSNKAVIPELNTLENLRRIAEKFQNIRDNNLDNSKAEKGIEIIDLKSDIDSVKDTLVEIADRLKYDKIPELPAKLKQYYDILISNEIEDKFAREIVFNVYENISLKDTNDDNYIRNLLIKEISDKIVLAPNLKISKNTSKVIAFIGPTGVGKTTTLCKIAAICKFFNHYNIAIVSIDTYRLAAIDQLKTFTDIANISLDIAYDSTELKNMIEKHRDKDIIFIDTVGRSPNNQDHLSELKRLLESISADEVHLIISANTSLSSMKEIVKNFGILMPNRLIFSKVDEAINYGNIINLINFSHLPISYLTTGQVIPDDIEVADKNKLAGLVIKSKNKDEWTN